MEVSDIKARRYRHKQRGPEVWSSWVAAGAAIARVAWEILLYWINDGDSGGCV